VYGLVWILACAERPSPPSGSALEVTDASAEGAVCDALLPPPDHPTLALEAGAVRDCAAPLDGVRWTEVAAQMGLSGSDGGVTEHNTGGIAVVDDFDLDGDLDIVLGFADGSPRYYERTAEGFVGGEIPGMGSIDPVVLTPSLADYDGDGLRDLLLAGPPSRTLRNTGAGFEPGGDMVASAAPVELAPLDVDGDGLLDLFAASTGDLNAGAEERADSLLVADAAGSWSAQSLDLAEAGGVAFDAVVFDWEGDGDQDVYVINDKGPEYGGNVLWENVGGELVSATERCGCGLVHSGMGGDMGDFNRDGRPDLYLSATSHNALLEAQADGTFADVAVALGADPLADDSAMSWGAIWLDHDNDGRLDLLVAEGDLWYDGQFDPVVQDLPIDLLRQTEDGVFEDRSELLGHDLNGSWRAVIAVDHNADGVLDLLITDVEAAPRLYMSDGCTAAGWLEVSAPLGSKVEICTDGVVQTAWSTTESSWGGAKPPTVHFGLGDAQAVERVVVTLLDGRIATAEGLEARRSLTVDGM